MAEQLYFSRDTKFYVVYENSAGVAQDAWEVPILDGFSFSQANNSSEITLAEMEDSGGVSRRGKGMFNDSLAPAEWSLSTYVRPYRPFAVAQVRAAEDVLWAMMMGADDYDSTTSVYDRNAVAITTQVGTGSGATGSTLMDFGQSNISSLYDNVSFYFVMGTGTKTAGPDHLVYKLTGATVNEATLDFDVDGIATINWSGFASQITDVSGDVFYDTIANEPGNGDPSNDGSGLAVGDIYIVSDNEDEFKICTNNGISTETYVTAIDTAVCSTNTFIRNRLSTVVVTSTGDTTAFPGDGASTYNYSLTLTGGSITISNNLTYLTPEELGCVNIPIGNITGARSVSGTMTAYVELDDGTAQGDNAGSTSALFKDFTTTGLDVVTNKFQLRFGIGGDPGYGSDTFGHTPTADTPLIGFLLEQAHLEIPVHSIDDVLGVEINFTGLPSTVSLTDEIVIAYNGPELPA
jgi:hypothetical protein